MRATHAIISHQQRCVFTSLSVFSPPRHVWCSNRNGKYNNSFRAGAPPTTVVFSVASQTGEEGIRQESSFETWLVLNSLLLSEYQPCCHTPLDTVDTSKVNSASLSPFSLQSKLHQTTPRGRLVLRLNCCVCEVMHLLDLRRDSGRQFFSGHHYSNSIDLHNHRPFIRCIKVQRKSGTPPNLT